MYGLGCMKVVYNYHFKIDQRECRNKQLMKI